MSQHSAASTPLPDPLVPADIDVDGIHGFLLHTDRLFHSELWALSTGEEFKAAVAVVPVWEDDPTARSFAVFYLPPSGGIWVLRPPGLSSYIEAVGNGTAASKDAVALRNDSFHKAVAHAESFIFGT
ncbi:hypothetical protein CTI14_16075 [Methylobacterium radiotolerans]|nr:hypothetical protein CTI14_16075 [Methylobacterium radiotolerans]